MSDDPTPPDDEQPPAVQPVTAAELLERHVVDVLARSAVVHRTRAVWPAENTSKVEAGIAWPPWSPHPFATVRWTLCGVPLEAWELMSDWPGERAQDLIDAAVTVAVDRLRAIVQERLMRDVPTVPAGPQGAGEES